MVKDQIEATPLQKNSAGAVWFNHLTPTLPLQEAQPSAPENHTRGAAAYPAGSEDVRDQATLKPLEPLEPPTSNDNDESDSIVNWYDIDNMTFGLLPGNTRRLKSFGVSIAVNGLICAAVLALTITEVHHAQVRAHKMKLTYLLHQKPYVPPAIKIKMPPVPVVEMAKIVPPKLIIMPAPPRVEPIKVATAAPVLPAAPMRRVVQPPAPVVGMFRSLTPAPAEAPKVAVVARAAGFGDPSGVAPNPNANRAAMLPAVGGFGAANSAAEGSSSKRGPVQTAGFGAGAGGGSPNGSAHGVVAPVGFGTGTQASSSGSRGSVSPVGFGTGPAAPAATAVRMQQSETTAIVVLAKPLPQYTAEARDMHIQGDVTLEVRFTASGEVDVLRVVNGLGHGLDEQAKLAAQRIRFKPAMRDGKPIDQVSVIHVAFQLA